MERPTRRQWLQRGAETTGAFLVVSAGGAAMGGAGKGRQEQDDIVTTQALGEEGGNGKPPRRLGRQLLANDSLDAFTTLDGKPVTKGWEVADGVLHRVAAGGDLLTKEEFADYELQFEWKVTAGANSGVKVRVAKFGNSWLGPEYQILDDEGHGNGRNPKTSAASLYDVFAPDSETKQLKPVGEWNHAFIAVRGSTLEHWLNGRRVLRCDTASEEWQAAVAASKFKNVDGFARNPKGRILIQDHGNEVWFRHVFLLESPPTPADDGVEVTTLATEEEGGGRR